VPAAAGTLIEHVKGEPEQPGLLTLRFAAVSAEVPVNGLPLTVVNVMIADCVFAEMYAGRRAVLVALFAGTVIVKCAAPETDIGVADVAAGAGTAWEPPPPHALSATSSTNDENRVRRMIKSPES
jgi:hypothetical protein